MFVNRTPIHEYYLRRVYPVRPATRARCLASSRRSGQSCTPPHFPRSLDARFLVSDRAIFNRLAHQGRMLHSLPPRALGAHQDRKHRALGLPVRRARVRCLLSFHLIGRLQLGFRALELDALAGGGAGAPTEVGNGGHHDARLRRLVLSRPPHSFSHGCRC